MAATTPLIVERSIVVNASQERVWKILTQSAHFAKWFEMDIKWGKLAVGEQMTFTMEGETEYGRIAIVEPMDRFGFYWGAETGRPEENLVTFRLEAVPDGTRVTVTESGFEALPEELRQKRFEMNDGGWKIQLENIDAYLKAGKDADSQS